MTKEEYTKERPLRVFTAFSGYDSQCMALKNKEVWRDIKGYEGVYQVSNLGRVKRMPLGKQWPYRKTHNNIRKPKLTKQGYLSVNLSKNNKVKCYFIHRLVAEAFIPNPYNYPVVNHLDENPLNNIVDNLEWCTHYHNCMYGHAREKQKASRWMNDPEKKTWAKALEARDRNCNCNSRKPVLQLDLDGNVIKKYASISEAGRICGFDGSSITMCCKGKRNKHKGFKWVYEKDYKGGYTL